MELTFQESSLKDLEYIADKDSHSILISGIRGCGKTYVANQFAKMKHISTFHSIQPKIADIRTMMSQSLSLSDNQVICIEDLDDGVYGTSQALLKYLEEPTDNIYVIITCNNVSKLTNTIPSRAIPVNIRHPVAKDLQEFAKYVNPSKYKQYYDSLVFKSCKSLSDIKSCMNFTYDQVQYFENYKNDNFLRGSVDSLMWNMSHFDDNQPCDISWCFKCIVTGDCSTIIKRASIDSLLQLEGKRISKKAILGEFAMRVKL